MAEETNKSPTEVRPSTEVSASEYSKAYYFLQDYIENPGNERVKTYDELTNTYPLGSHLKTLIESKGKISKENKKNRFIYSEGSGNWNNPRWSAADHKKVGLRATHVPENNCIQISCSTTKNGYELFIPVDTSIQGLFVKQTLPSIEIWDGEGALGYNPSSERYKNDPDSLTMYSECLYESVSNLLTILPGPTTT